MASNYTPQAGDVIESPDKSCLVRLSASSKAGMWSIEINALPHYWTTWKYGGIVTSNVLAAMGWTLVSRKEVQDGH